MPPAVVTVQPRAHSAAVAALQPSMRLALPSVGALGDADGEPGHRTHDGERRDVGAVGDERGADGESGAEPDGGRRRSR